MRLLIRNFRKFNYLNRTRALPNTPLSGHNYHYYGHSSFSQFAYCFAAALPFVYEAPYKRRASQANEKHQIELKKSLEGMGLHEIQATLAEAVCHEDCESAEVILGYLSQNSSLSLVINSAGIFTSAAWLDSRSKMLGLFLQHKNLIKNETYKKAFDQAVTHNAITNLKLLLENISDNTEAYDMITDCFSKLKTREAMTLLLEEAKKWNFLNRLLGDHELYPLLAKTYRTQ